MWQAGAGDYLQRLPSNDALLMSLSGPAINEVAQYMVLALPNPVPPEMLDTARVSGIVSYTYILLPSGVSSCLLGGPQDVKRDSALCPTIEFTLAS